MYLWVGEWWINLKCEPQTPFYVLQLIRELGNINVKKKEPPFCYPYSLKARVLVLAQLARMDISEEIEEGKMIWTTDLKKDVQF